MEKYLEERQDSAPLIGMAWYVVWTHGQVNGWCVWEAISQQLMLGTHTHCSKLKRRLILHDPLK